MQVKTFSVHLGIVINNRPDDYGDLHFVSQSMIELLRYEDKRNFRKRSLRKRPQ